jgi:mRNA-degrading endonuclease toxin of MazEF toxin-antitoxin module
MTMTLFTTNEIVPGDICLISFPFSSDPNGERKKRPVVVIGNYAGDSYESTCLVLMITGSKERVASPRPTDFLIASWVKAGLAKPSVVRTNRVWGAEASDFNSRLGKVSDVTLREIQNIFRNTFGLN